MRLMSGVKRLARSRADEDAERRASDPRKLTPQRHGPWVGWEEEQAYLRKGLKAFAKIHRT